MMTDLELLLKGGEGLTVEFKEKYTSEIVADLFHRMDKSERMGSGIGRIRKFLKEAGVKPPKFESNMFFTITFQRPEEYRSMRGTQKGYPET